MGIKLQKFHEKASANFIENLNWIRTEFIFSVESSYKRMRSSFQGCFQSSTKTPDLLMFCFPIPLKSQTTKAIVVNLRLKGGILRAVYASKVSGVLKDHRNVYFKHLLWTSRSRYSTDGCCLQKVFELADGFCEVGKIKIKLVDISIRARAMCKQH